MMMVTDRRVETAVGGDGSIREELHRLLQQQSIRSVYQPIVSLSDGTAIGYEALTRGPDDSPLHKPAKLFACAESEDLLYPLDRLARTRALEGLTFLKEGELLFLNLPSTSLRDPKFMSEAMFALMAERGLTPAHIVLEITERTSITDFAYARRVLEPYRKQGYRFAIDDAGAGYSSLQAIAELQPDYVKADHSLVQDIHRSKAKESIIETLLAFSLKTGTQLIAEGVESPGELLKLLQMGVRFGQGYLLGRPDDTVKPLASEVKTMILQNRREPQNELGLRNIGALAARCRTFREKETISVVAEYFKRQPEAPGAVLVRDDRPVGLIMRERLFQQLAGQYGYSLFWNRTIDQVMNRQPLMVDEHMPVEEVSQLATSRDIQNLYDLVIITSGGRIKGTASIRSILESITSARMESAKVASPLTGLPGNLQIHRELNKRLTDRKPFAVIYADLDYFKWFNDRFGFQRGDQLIQFTAECMQQGLAAHGQPLDFIGHIGGDDFIVMTGAEQPEKLCADILHRFDHGVTPFYEGAAWHYVEDRSGNRIESDGVTLSLSLVMCTAEMPVTTEQISQSAAVLKKRSKAQRGSVYCIDRLGLTANSSAEAGLCVTAAALGADQTV